MAIVRMVFQYSVMMMDMKKGETNGSFLVVLVEVSYLGKFRFVYFIFATKAKWGEGPLVPGGGGLVCVLVAYMSRAISPCQPGGFCIGMNR